MGRELEATARLALCPHCGERHGEDTLRCPGTDMLLPLEGRRLDNKFRFRTALGTGGMAAVWLAVNERVDREVAIKFLRPEVGRDSEAVARFRSEAKAAGRIGNKHICEILDLGDSPIGPYIVMERLRGIDLAGLIRREGRLRPGYAVRVVRHALEGLAAAHAAGIVHRDLKPGNLFMHQTPAGDTVVKLMDFGVSKFLDGSGEAETASGILLGTPEYMAPEQLEGAHKIGPAADIFAMGAILYRAITGHQVFSGPNLAAVIKSMAMDEVTPMSQLVEGLPPALEAVIHRCLERDPEARYPSAEALSDALEPFEELDIEVEAKQAPERTQSLPLSSSELGDAAEAGEAEAEAKPGESATQIWEQGVAPTRVHDEVPTARRVKARRNRAPLWLGALALLALLGFGAVALFGGDDEGDEERVAELADDDGALAAATGETGGGDTGGGTDTGAATDTGGDTDTGPAAEHEDGGDTDTGGDTGTGGDSGGEGWSPAGDRPPPPGTFRAGPYISPKDPAGTTDLAGAKRHCDRLANQRYAGVGKWTLANPAQLGKFIGNGEVKLARYWSSALWKGKGLVYWLPGGKKSREKAERSIARPLCIARW